MKNYLWILMVMIGFIFCFPTYTSAQEIELGISPASYEIVAKPGQQVPLEYIIENTKDPATLQLHVKKITAQDSQGNMTLEPYSSEEITITSSTGAAVLNTPFLLRSKERKIISLNINVAENLNAQDYYFAILAESIPQSNQEGSTKVNIKTTISSVLILSVSPTRNIPSRGNILLFDVKPQYNLNFGNKKIYLFDSLQPIPVIFAVENNGDYHIKTQGEMILTQGKTPLNTFSLPSQYVFAHSERTLKGAESSLCKEKQYKKVCENFHTILISPQNIGEFTLKGSLITEENTPGAYVTTTFYVFPITVTLWIIGFIILCCLLYLLKNYVKAVR